MKLECEVEKLKNAVTQAERIIGKNLTLPILNSILLIASGKSLKLRATNLSLGLEIEIPTKIEQEGIIAIPGAVLLGVFSHISQNENISIESSNGNILIKTKKNKIKLKGGQYEDFPTIPVVEGKTFEIESKKLIDGIKSVYYSASFSDIKPEISSVFIYKEDKNLIFVSTDSFRLAEKKIKLKDIEEIDGIIIPFKNIPEILRVIGDFLGLVRVCFNKNQISFSFNNTYLTSRVIDGVFPDYRQIIPKDIKTKAVLLKQDLLNALKLSNIFSDKFNQINLSINPKEGVFELSSKNNDIGENKTYIEAVLEGEKVALSFNHKYFLDCFQSINTDSIVVEIVDAAHPILISPVSDSSFTYLIMPMNK